MSPDNEKMLIKSSKPPPPVPPRPSKSLVKEALAKTRKAHQVTVSAITTTTNEPRLNQSPEDIGHPKATNHVQTSSIFLRCERIQDNSRPVVYQSNNCKSRPKVPAPRKPPNGACTTSVPRTSTEPVSKRLEVDTQEENGTSQTKVEDGTSKTAAPVNSSRSDSLHRLNEADAATPKNPRKESDAQTTSSGTEEESSSLLSTSPQKLDELSDKTWEEALKDKNHVNTLIDEMFASVLEVNLSSSISPTSSLESFKDQDNVIKISTHYQSESNSDSETFKSINSGTGDDGEAVKKPINERKVKFNDRENHEFLIEELQNMKNNNGTDSKTQSESDSHSGDKIQINDWYGVSDGKKVRMSSCHIKVDDTESEINDRSEKIKELSQTYRLPPLPKALSGFNINEPSKPTLNESVFPKIHNGREETNLDRQLAILRREMACLREQDMFLLSKLWFLSEAIQDFRQMLQSQDDEKVADYVLPPSPTPSSIEDEDYNYLISTSTC